MAWQIEGVRCNSFRHHFLQCYTVSLMCFLLICCIHDSWFKVSNIFSFVEHEVFIGIIGDKYVDRCLALDLVNATNYVDVWIPSFGSTVICKEVCYMGFDNGSTYLNWYNTIVSGVVS